MGGGGVGARDVDETELDLAGSTWLGGPHESVFKQIWLYAHV